MATFLRAPDYSYHNAMLLLLLLYHMLLLFCLQDEISEELGNMRIKPAKLKGIGESMSKNKLLAKRKEKGKK